MIRLLLLCALICLATANSNPATEVKQFMCDVSDADRLQVMDKVADNMQSLGYEVIKGTFRFLSGNSGYFANPSSSYGVYEFHHVGLPFYTSGLADAVLFYGCTPPPLKYFGLRTWGFWEQDPFAVVFAELGNTNNILTVNTTRGEGEDIFSKSMAVVSTPDRNVYTHIHEQLLTAYEETVSTRRSNLSPFLRSNSKRPNTTTSPPPDFVNLDSLSPSLLHTLGRDFWKSDLLMFLYRVALFEEKEMEASFLNVTWPVYQFWLKEGISPPFPAAPYEKPVLRERGTGKTEMYLKGDLGSLQISVAEFWKKRGFVLKQLAYMEDKGLDSYTCLANRTNCLGVTYDATYAGANGTFPSGTKFTLGDPALSRTFVLIGANHNATGKAVYSNFAVEKLTGGSNGVIAVENERFEGSAGWYNSTLENARDLFAYTFGRSCSLSLSPAASLSLPYCAEVSSTQLGDSEAFGVAERAYLERETRAGPLGSELLQGTLLIFEREQ